eukprot:gnl/Spiro4/3443_TR1681_c0_g1_i1.p1 gnl/Spiro4/3443_TR1681_c0_g1~~gnl/Spiro4/3443_TR1681_c0_g1_i1.p1  ORF type:complete len:192 (+),score=55.20 gnl/Spiro4/3443_TR1681_c0_g1_i1:44-577(+)
MLSIPRGIKLALRAVSTATAAPRKKLIADPAEWTVSVPISVRWGDMDAFSHVNNTKYFCFFEDARLKLMQDCQLTRSESVILAETSCKFMKPLRHPDTVDCCVRTLSLTDDKWVLEGIVYSHAIREIAAYGTAVLVFYDYDNNRKVSCPPRVRAYLESQMRKLEEHRQQQQHQQQHH